MILFLLSQSSAFEKETNPTKIKTSGIVNTTRITTTLQDYKTFPKFTMFYITFKKYKFFQLSQLHGNYYYATAHKFEHT